MTSAVPDTASDISLRRGTNTEGLSLEITCNKLVTLREVYARVWRCNCRCINPVTETQSRATSTLPLEPSVIPCTGFAEAKNLPSHQLLPQILKSQSRQSFGKHVPELLHGLYFEQEDSTLHDFLTEPDCFGMEVLLCSSSDSPRCLEPRPDSSLPTDLLSRVLKKNS